MLTIILIVVIALIAIFAVVVGFQPAGYGISRSAIIAAPPATVFANVNDFHLWNAWSPWAKLDPAAKNTFEGAPAGTGAIFKWSGNKKIGEGQMTLTDSHPIDRIRIKLEFVRPFKSTANTEFAFNPQRDQTAVTWTMSGRNNFMAKAFCMFMNMDKMVGGDFERGLSQLKSVSETADKN
jgi:hypothetical protein